MPRRTHVGLAVVLAILVFPASAGAVATQSLLVAVKPTGAAERLVRDQGGQLVSRRLSLWKVGAGAAARMLPRLSAKGLLRYSEPNYVRFPAAPAGTDPLVPGAWQLARVGADLATPPGPGVPITIVDGGILLSYPELAGRPNVESLNPQPTDANPVTAHGTAIAALAGAPANGVGTVGVYPDAALASYALPGFDDASIIAALDSVATLRPSVVNLSLAGPGYSQALYEAILRLVDAGSIVVAAAGNSLAGHPAAYYPADYPHVLTVGSTGRDDTPSPFSIRSPFVDLAAPGEELSVLDPEHPSQPIELRGTSYSTPIVSAAAAWLWTSRPDLQATQVTELLRRTAHDVGLAGFDRATGLGIPSIPAALAATPPPEDPQEPNDDVSLVVAGGLFAKAKAGLTGTIRARVDESEDPRDVYRLAVPAGATATITLEPRADLGLRLWSANTDSVVATGADARRHRLAASNRKGKAAERVTWRNRSRADTSVFVEVWISAKKGLQRSGYTLAASSG